VAAGVYRGSDQAGRKKRVVEITRKMVQGTLEHAQVLLSASQGGTVLDTAFIERLNGTIFVSAISYSGVQKLYPH
jgi:hypothetical protein